MSRYKHHQPDIINQQGATDLSEITFDEFSGKNGGTGSFVGSSLRL